MSKNKNRPKRQQKKPKKQEYKKAPRGRKFNPYIYKYFDMTKGYEEDNDGQ